MNEDISIPVVDRETYCRSHTILDRMLSTPVRRIVSAFATPGGKSRNGNCTLDIG